jgi:hypothetical protein
VRNFEPCSQACQKFPQPMASKATPNSPIIPVSLRRALSYTLVCANSRSFSYWNSLRSWSVCRMI